MSHERESEGAGAWSASPGPSEAALLPGDCAGVSGQACARLGPSPSPPVGLSLEVSLLSDGRKKAGDETALKSDSHTGVEGICTWGGWSQPSAPCPAASAFPRGLAVTGARGL